MSSQFAIDCSKFAIKHPHPDTRPTQSWNQLCALLIARLGLASGTSTPWAVSPRAFGDALPIAKATAKVTPLNTNSALAPIGAFHFWLIAGSIGHVGVDANGGGRSIFMATSHLTEVVNPDIGYSTEAAYTKFCRSQGGHYLGWATNYNGGHYHLPLEVVPDKAPVLTAAQRKAGPSGVNARVSFTTAAAMAAKQGIGPNEIVTFDGYVTGSSVTVGKTASDLWYVRTIAGTSFYYAAAAFATSPSTAGLKNLTVTPVEPLPAPVVITPVETQPADGVPPAAPVSPPTQPSPTAPPTKHSSTPSKPIRPASSSPWAVLFQEIGAAIAKALDRSK